MDLEEEFECAPHIQQVLDERFDQLRNKKKPKTFTEEDIKLKLQKWYCDKHNVLCCVNNEGCCIDCGQPVDEFMRSTVTECGRKHIVCKRTDVYHDFLR